jgi:hypothetical protein
MNILQNKMCNVCITLSAFTDFLPMALINNDKEVVYICPYKASVEDEINPNENESHRHEG